MSFFGDPDELLQMLRDLGAERVVYKPAGGPEREVWAIVDRLPGEPHFASDRAKQARLSLTVRQARLSLTVVNDGTRGIATDTYSSGGDTVALPARVGEPHQVFQLTGEPAEQDAGLVRFFVR